MMVLVLSDGASGSGKTTTNKPKKAKNKQKNNLHFTLLFDN